jgi:diketogulonate reductase-like aldo/keto reductase
VPVTTSTRTTTLASGEQVPVLGQGTWHLGDGRHPAAEEAAALRLGLDLGLTLIDTAEMYGNGAAERLVGEAIADRRDEVFLVSKVLPQHATAKGTVEACEASLRRLRTDRLDLYLLHWRGRVPLVETLRGFQRLQQDGLIRYWGVSNFYVADLAELVLLPGGSEVAADQMPYSLAHRAIEYEVLPWCLERGLPVMAYSPLEQGRLLSHPVLAAVAARHHATPAQVAIAWVLDHEHVIAIPQAATLEHVRESRAALDLRLTAADLADLEDAFPPPLWPGRPRAY